MFPLALRASAPVAGPTVTVPLRVKRVLWSAADGSCVIAACAAGAGTSVPAGATRDDFRAIFPRDLGGRVAAGARLDCVGGWAAHTTYGPQLRVTGVTDAPPERASGLADWLVHNCPGIGPATARRVVASLGPEALRVLQGDPGAAVTRLGFLREGQREALRQAAARLREAPERARHHVWCREHGLGPALTERVWTRWGARAPVVLGADPYLLAELDRAGWVTADALAERLGTDPLAPGRLRAALLFALEQAARMQGHTHRSLPEVLAATRRLIARTGRPAVPVPDRPLHQALFNLAEQRLLIYEPVGDRVALAVYDWAEREVAALVVGRAAARLRP